MADIACDGALTERDAAQLEQLLHGNVEAQQYYLTHVSLDQVAAMGVRTSSARADAARPSPIFGFLSPALHSTLDYFSEGMPLAYLLATVITGLGLLVGSLVHVSRPEQIVRNSVRQAVVEPNGLCRPDHRHGRLQVERRFSCFLRAEG